MNGGEKQKRRTGEKEHDAIHPAAGDGFSSAPAHSRRTSLLYLFLDWLRSKKPIRRYRVTPRQNSRAFRRTLLHDALLELKRDAAFAIPHGQRQIQA